MSRLLKPEDFYRIKLVASPCISPDGQQVAYVLTEVDRERYQYRRMIWVAPVEGGEPRRFTAGPDDSAPAWSPDGSKIAFVRSPLPEDKAATEDELKRGVGKAQIWVMPSDGGEALKLTWMRLGTGAPVWSPDGRSIAFTARTGPAQDEEAWLASVAERPIPRVRTIDRLWYRLDTPHGSGFVYEHRTHLFLTSADGSGEPRQLTKGDYDVDAPAFSADGSRIVFTADQSAERWRWPAPSVWMLDLRNGEQTRLSDESVSAHGPEFSPDGHLVAFVAGKRRHADGHTDLYVSSVDEPGQQRLLSSDFVPTCQDTSIDDMRVGHGAVHLRWATDGSEVYFLASMRGTTHVYAARPEGDLLPRRVTEGDCAIYGFSMDQQASTVALALSTPVIPGDLYVQALGRRNGATATGDRRRLSNVNRELFSEVELVAPQEMDFTGADGWSIQGWTMRPPHAAEGERVPAILEVHGGPAAMYGFSFMLEFQLLAAQGYEVVYCNPRGSTGYGRVFSGAVINDWGGKDYADVMAALDAAIARGGIDPNRLGIAGGSYGGFMTNWAVSHTDRFKAGVTMRSVVNMETMFGTSDMGWDLIIDELSAMPWGEGRQRLQRFSPITYVENIHTPLLIIHSDHDLRCPIGEAEQLYSALKYLERPTEFVIFEGQSHDLSRAGHPRSRVIRYQKVLDWFQRYAREAPGAVGGNATAKSGTTAEPAGAGTGGE